MQSPAAARCQTPARQVGVDELARGRGEMADVRRASALVVHDRDLVPLGAEPEHRPYEVVAGRPEEPGRAHDPGVGAGGCLAVELRAAVGRERIRGRPTRRTARACGRRRRSRSRTRRAGARARRRSPSRRRSRRPRLVGRPRRRPRPSTRRRAGRGRDRPRGTLSRGAVRHVPVLVCERDDVVVRERLAERAAELAAGARDQDATASRADRIGVLVLHRCATRGSFQGIVCSSGSAGSYSA